MSHRPLLQPNSPKVPPSWDRTSPRQTDDESAEDHLDVTQLARTLAAHGGGSASLDLALDLVLNEVVDEARRVTGATGAAIALNREGEMVCRASSGANAPELGVRRETKSGLSGAALQTGIIQQCNDAQADPRVNAEDCRQLGIKSILIIPLSDGEKAFGILEVFSSSPNAFGEREIRTLQFLAYRVIQNKRAVEQAPAILAGPDNNNSNAPAEKVETKPKEAEPPTKREEVATSAVESAAVEPSEAETSFDEELPREPDIWTPILSVLVVIAAVLLGLMIGFRGAIRGSRSQPHQRASVPSAGTGSQETRSEQTSGSAPGATSAQSPGDGSGSQPRRSSPVSPVEAPVGGLVVTQDGKVIFQQSPSEPGASPAPTGEEGTPGPAKSRGTSGTPRSSAKAENSREDFSARLIHRVEPEYPDEARTQHIQGDVILDVQIGRDGKVRNISPITGDPLLTQAAIRAVRQWTYQPYSVDGRPAEMQTRITIKFTLPPS